MLLLVTFTLSALSINLLAKSDLILKSGKEFVATYA